MRITARRTLFALAVLAVVLLVIGLALRSSDDQPAPPPRTTSTAPLQPQNPPVRPDEPSGITEGDLDYRLPDGTRVTDQLRETGAQEVRFAGDGITGRVRYQPALADDGPRTLADTYRGQGQLSYEVLGGRRGVLLRTTSSEYVSFLFTATEGRVLFTAQVVGKRSDEQQVRARLVKLANTLKLQKGT